MSLSATALKTFQEPSRPPRGQRSIAGGGSSWGLPAGEYLGAWSFPNYIAIVDTIRRVESAVAALESAIINPLRAVEWYLEPNPEGGEDEAALLQQNLMEDMPESTWDDLIYHALLAAMYGFTCVETLTMSAAPGEPAMFRGFSPLHWSTVQKINCDREGRFESVEQWASYPDGSGFATLTIEAGRLALFTYNEEAGNKRGFPLTRRIYRDYLFRDKTYRLLIVGLQRFWAGFPVVTLGRDADPDDFDAAESKAKNLNAVENAYWIQQDGDDIRLESLRSSEGVAIQILEHYGRQILRAGLAQFLALGESATGSRALASSHGEFFLLQEIALAQWFAATVKRQIIDRWYRWNFPDAPRPKLRWGSLRSLLTPQEVAEAFTSLLQAGAVTKQDEDEDLFRNTFELPARRERPEGEAETTTATLRDAEESDEVETMAEPIRVTGTIASLLDREPPDATEFPLWEWRSGPKPDCPFCASMRGRIFQTGGPEEKMIPGHFGCDCYQRYFSTANAQNLDLTPDLAGVDVELMTKHAHWANPATREKFAHLKTQAGPSGVPWEFRRFQDPVTEEMVSVLRWKQGMTSFPVEGFENLLPSKEQVESGEFVDLESLAGGLMALDRLPAGLRPQRVLIQALGDEAVRRRGRTVAVSVPALQEFVRAGTLWSVDEITETQDVSLALTRAAQFGEEQESFLLTRAVLKPSRVTADMARLFADEPDFLTGLGLQDPREDAADWLAYAFLRSLRRHDGRPLRAVPEFAGIEDSRKFGFYNALLGEMQRED